MPYSALDKFYMLQVIEEARKDPRKYKVGAVIVTRDNQVIRAHGGGGPLGKNHAEFNAITQRPTTVDLDNATIYTTLEPCVDCARTAPDLSCAQLIITRGIRRVVIGLVDTDPRVSHKGIDLLRDDGHEVDLCSDEAIQAAISEMMKPFLLERRPAFRPNFPFALDIDFVGRVGDRKFLTDWLCRQGEVGSLPVLVLYGLGGLGKSSLAWLWSNRDVAGRELPHAPDDPIVTNQCAVPRGVRADLRVIWFTFYENEGGEPFHAFLEKAIYWISGGDRVANQYRRADASMDYDALTKDLLGLISSRRCLIIWDGAERLLWEYFDPDALGHDGTSSAPEAHRPIDRRFADRLVTLFVKAFTNEHISKLLILSRVPCDDLNAFPAEQRPLATLDIGDAVKFLQRRRIQGAVSSLRDAAKQYGFHPLSLSMLAAAINDDFTADGHINNAPQFDPGKPPEFYRQHVLAHAFRKRSGQLRNILCKLSAVDGTIDKPLAHYLLIGDDALNEKEVGRDLSELVRHGLVRKNEEGNLDLHPLVRGYAYEQIPDKTTLHERLAKYYADLIGSPVLARHAGVERRWVATAIAFYYHKCRSGNYQTAVEFLKSGEDKGERNLNAVLWYELGQCWEYIRLLRELFPDGTDAEPTVNLGWIPFVVNDLALAYLMVGELRRAETLFDRVIHVSQRIAKHFGWNRGALQGAYRAKAQGLEGRGHVRLELGQLEAARKDFPESIDSYSVSDKRYLHQHPLKLSCDLLSILGWDREFREFCDRLRRDVPNDPDWHTSMCKHCLSQGDVLGAATALKDAETSAQALAEGEYQARQKLEIENLKGELALFSGNLTAANSSFEKALAAARRQAFLRAELRAILGLAGVRLSEARTSVGDAQTTLLRESRELATEAASYAERSEYVLVQADSHNVLAQIALAEHDPERAREHANQAKQFASCGSKHVTDGSYCYASVYREATRLLSDIDGNAQK